MAPKRKKTAAKRAPARKRSAPKKPVKLATKARRAPAKKAATRATARTKPALKKRSAPKPMTAQQRRNAAAVKLGYRNEYARRQAVAAEAARKKKAHEAYERRKDAKRAREAANATAYERRDQRAKAAGYESYWDERQSRTRAREALRDLGHPNPDAQDAATLRDVDELGLLGRGQSARELFYATRKILEKYEPSPSDSQIWAIIRIFYKPKSHR